MYGTITFLIGKATTAKGMTQSPKGMAKRVRASASVLPLCQLVNDASRKDNAKSSMLTQVSSLMFQDEWQKATEIVRSNEMIARKKITSPYFMNEGYSEIFLIHLACSISSVPVTFLETLFHAYPECSQATDSRKRNCLQIALKSGISEEALLFLITKDPNSAAQQDCYGRVALHYACSNCRSETVIQHLVDACPAAVCADEALDGGWTPLHIVAQNCYSSSVARILIACSSQPLLMTTKSGHTPLSLNQRRPSRTPSQLSIASILSSEEKRFVHLPIFQNYSQESSRSLVEASYFV